MLDFTGVRSQTQTLADLARPLTVVDLHHLTDDMLDTMFGIIVKATDADITFQPVDPLAHDAFGDPEEAELAWTLGHVIVHATASAEEAAAIAASLARGVLFEGRSRYETDWRSVTTLVQARQRLHESRRMRHAFLNAWPDQPHLDVTPGAAPVWGQINATARFIAGLMHDDAHLDQMREIMRQARVARGVAYSNFQEDKGAKR
jgi:hypothetical protein